MQCFGDATGTYTPTSSELTSQGLTYRPHQISAGCDFLSALTTQGILGVYEHSSRQLTSYASTWPTVLSRDSNGLDTSGTTYVQVASGTFAVYALTAGGCLAAYGRVFSSSVGPVAANTDTTGTATSFSGYLQRSTSSGIGVLAANSGFGHACSIKLDGSGLCWGADYSSQATVGNSQSSLSTAHIQPSLLGTVAASPHCPTSNVTSTSVAHRCIVERFLVFAVSLAAAATTHLWR